jgi:hypothetical protein
MENEQNSNNIQTNDFKLDDKYNIQFSMLCQIFESSIKQKTKSKAKYIAY